MEGLQSYFLDANKTSFELMLKVNWHLHFLTCRMWVCSWYTGPCITSTNGQGGGTRTDFSVRLRTTVFSFEEWSHRPAFHILETSALFWCLSQDVKWGLRTTAVSHCSYKNRTDEGFSFPLFQDISDGIFLPFQPQKKLSSTQCSEVRSQGCNLIWLVFLFY